MKSVQGAVAMLGYTQVHNSVVEYNVIEIGDQILSDIEVPKPLVKYLVRASHASSEQTVLYLHGNRLLGIREHDGKTHYFHTSYAVLAGWFVLSIALIPVFGLGIYSLWHCVRHYGYVRVASTLKDEGGIMASR
jgi:hypothetical protein